LCDEAAEEGFNRKLRILKLSRKLRDNLSRNEKQALHTHCRGSVCLTALPVDESNATVI
jgi:hypothetical protein